MRPSEISASELLILFTRKYIEKIAVINSTLCGTPNYSTLKHILNKCPTALNQGIFTRRHDSLLEYIIKYLNLVKIITPS